MKLCHLWAAQLLESKGPAIWSPSRMCRYMYSGTGETAQQLRMLASLAEDPSLIRSTHIEELTNALNVPGEPVPSSGFHRQLHSHAYTAKHTHIHVVKNKINLK